MKKRTSKPKSRVPRNMFNVGTLPSRVVADNDVMSTVKKMSKIYSFDFQLAPLNFTLTAGLLKQRFQFSQSSVVGLANMILNFEEVRFRGVRFTPKMGTMVTPSGYIATGNFKMWLDDAILSAATPTYTDAFSRQTVELPVLSTVRPDAKRELQWVAADIEDQDWVSVPSGAFATFVPFTFCVFAGTGYVPSATGGTGTSSGDSISTAVVDGAARVEFRTLRNA